MMKTTTSIAVLATVFALASSLPKVDRVNASASAVETWNLEEDFICPDSQAISPCICETWRASITCSGVGVVEGTLSRVFRVLREANGLAAGELLNIHQFKLEESSLSELDWTPFLNTAIYHLEISNNNFSKISGPPLEEIQNRGQIETSFLYFKNNIFRTIGQSLAYFAPEYMAKLSLKFEESVAFQVDVTAPQLLPGLFAFEWLQEFELSSTGLERLGSRQFAGLKRLQYLTLAGNRLSSNSSIPSDAFEFDESPTNLLNSSLLIKLSGNPKLSEGSFLANSSLSRSQRPVFLSLTQTGVTTLPQDIFEPFLEAHVQNELVLWDCPIKCDGRVRWLKERREEFESKVNGANCVDNPRLTIFTSDLTDGDDGSGSNRFSHNSFILKASIITVSAISIWNFRNNL